MYYILDAALLILMIFIIASATRRGFVKAVFKFLTVIASAGVAVAFYRPLGQLLDERFVRAWLLSRQLNIPNPLSALDFSKLLEENEALSQISKRVGVDLPQSVLNSLISSSSSAAEGVTDALSAVISNLLAFVLIFVGALIVLKLLSLLLNAACKLPVLRTLNRVLGFVFGLCEAVIIGVVISTVLVGICESYGMIQPDFPLADVGTSTYLIRALAGVVQTSGAV